MRVNKYLNRVIVFLIILIIGVFFKNKLGDFSFGFVNNESYVADSSNLEIYYFDVGQADSIFIKNNSDTVLIDAGNNEDGEKIVDYLKNEIKIDDIDIVVGTHPHEDHIGGLDDIIDSFDIGKIYLPDVTSTSKTFDDLLNSILENDYKISVPIEDEIFELGNLKFKVIYTGKDEGDLNNASIVLRLLFGNTAYLFTGDITSKVENKILDKDIKVDVLKVAHHGSNYSSTNDFLNIANPRYAIIQVGENNKYDHPSEEILKRFSDRGINFYRTDVDGTIKIVSDGNEIDVNKLGVSLDG